MTLFVTATTLGTSNRPYVDSFGRGFGIADHRHLYRFRRTEDGRVVYRPGSGPVESWWHDGHVGVGGLPAAVVDDFDRGDAGARTALITAARASASFPVAFAPVREGRDLAARRVLPAAAVDCEGHRWLVDGGVLDNAPFEPVLDAISRRPATEPVRRLLIYVVPSLGQEGHGLEQAQAQMDAVAAEGGPHAPWGGILGSAIGFPREGDVRADMEYAAQLLGQGEATETSPQVGPEALFHTEIDGPTGAADGLFDQYRRARAVGGLQDVRNALARAQEGSGLVLAPAAGAHVTRLLAEDPPWVPANDTSLRTGGGPPWQWGLATAERACRLMVRDLWGRSVDRESVRLVAEALGKVEAVRDAVALRLTHDAHTAPMDVLELVSWTRARFAALQVQEALTHCVHSAAEAYAAARRAVEHKDGDAPGVQPADVIRAALTVEVATQAFTAYQPFRRTAPFEFLRLGPDVESAFVDCAGRSAEAAQHAVEEAESRGDRKLYGTRMQHFAAFGLPEWRAWDWTAGRLDAQTHLARAVRKGSRDRVGILDWTADVQRQTVQAELGLQPEQWAAQRDALLDKSDKGLIHDLRGQEYGNTLVVSVVDAVMRALPHELALDKMGLLLNALLARKPQRRFVKWWAPLVRFPARRKWLNWTDSLGMDDGEPAPNGHREPIRR